jgi:hypothetical protein
MMVRNVSSIEISDFISENVNNILSTTTIGMEIEHNHNQRFNVPNIIYRRYIHNYYYENDYILEYNIRPNKLKNIRNVIRKYTLISYFLTKGKFNYDTGMIDRYSGSNHLHIYIPYLHRFIQNRNYINPTFNNFMKGIQYLYLPFFSRTSQTFRINSAGRFHLINQNILNTNYSKSISVTLRGVFYKLEFRINENFIPLYAYILTPVLVIGYLYCANNFDNNNLSEYEKNLIEEIIDYGQTIDEQIPSRYKRIQVLALRKIRTKKRDNRENRRKFLRLHRNIFRYVNTLVNNHINNTGITNKRLLKFIINYYYQQRLYFENISKSQLYIRNRDNIEYKEDNPIFKNNPNTKLLKMLLKYLIEHDRKTRELVNRNNIRNIIDFINS